MKNNFIQLRKDLLQRGVRLEGFGVWLHNRVLAHRYGLDSMYRSYFMPPYEKIWEGVYQNLLENRVNVSAFAYWLLGLPPAKKTLLARLFAFFSFS